MHLFSDLFFNNTDEAIMILDESGKILDINAKGIELLGNPKEALAGKPFRELGIDPTVTLVHEIKRADGTPFLVRISSKKRSSAGREYTLVFLEEIFLEQRDEKRVFNTEDLQLLSSLKEAPAINIWSIDKEYRYTFFNDPHRDGMKQVWNADIHLGQSVLDYIKDKEYRERVENVYKLLLAGKSLRSIDNLKTIIGKNRYYENFSHPLYDSSNNITGAMIYTIDITDRIELEERLRGNIALLESIMNSPEQVAIFSLDREYRYLFFNEAHREAMQRVRGTEPELGVSIFNFLPDPEHRKRAKEFYDKAFGGDKCSAVTNVVDLKGREIYRSNISAPIRDSVGRVIGITMFILDITELVEAQQKLKESLLEKEILLKEIHHRVKNNFQLISSILELQVNSLKDEKAQNALKDSQNRIDTMTRIHTTLYSGSSLATVNMEDYILPLITHIKDLYLSEGKNLEIHSHFEEISLDIERAIPLGLIINELFTNSIKYAFVEKKSGNVWVIMERVEGDRIHLKIRDDGIGLPADFNPEDPKGLGTLIVTALTSQLNGEINYKRGSGTAVDIYF